MRRACRILLTAVVVAATVPAAASAETRYIGPAGSAGATPCTTKATPCPLATALIQVQPDTTLSFAPGFYDLGPSGLAPVPAVHLEPTEPGTRPVLASDTESFGTSAVTLAAGSTVRGLEIRATGAFAGTGLRFAGIGAVAREVVVRGGAGGIAAYGGTLANATVTADGSSAAAVFAQANVVGGTLTVVNVTALAPDPTGTAIAVQGEQIAFGGAGRAIVRNTIAIGGAYDLRVDGGNPLCSSLPPLFSSCGSGSLSVDHSLFAKDAGATKGDGNRTGDAGFVDRAGGDLHLRADSQLIDQGVADPLAGTADVDGGPRVTGGAIDIGADEYTPAPPPAPATTTPTGDPADTTAPVLGRLALTRTRFAVAPRPTALTAATRRAPRGTTIDTAANEVGTLTLTMERARAGRRSGARCVKPTAKLRRAKACVRRVPIGALTRRIAAAGPISVAFSGRLGRLALPAGAYRLTGVLTDAAGNRSAPRQATFTVVKP